MAGDPYLALSPEEMARQEAASYLASQGVPGYSPAPPPAMSAAGGPPPPAEMPPPPPAPAQQPSLANRAVRDANIGGAIGGLLGPWGMPIGAAVGAGHAARGALEDYANSQAKPPAPPENNEPFGPPGPAPQPNGDDAPLYLNGPQQGGGQRMVSPAGMYPHSMTTQAHMGHEVPEEAKRAYGAATALDLEGADKRSAADRDYYAQVRNAQEARMQATTDAATNHARVQAQRDAIVKQHVAKIESLNAEASAEIDPEHLASTLRSRRAP